MVLASVQELALDGILVVDEHDRVVSYNHRFVAMWGIPPGVLGTKSDAALLEAVTGMLVAPQEFRNKVEYLYRHQDETSRDELQLIDDRIFDRYSAPMHVEGRYYGRVWYFRDITETRRSEAALRASEHNLEVALGAARMGTFEWDLLTNKVVWSHGSEQLFGFAPNTFAGTHDAFEQCVHPKDLPGLRQDISRSIVSRVPFAAEFRVNRPDGSERWIAGRGEFTFDASGRAMRLRGIGLDVTERKQSEEQIRRGMENTVAALAATCEARDPYTAGHQRHVAELAVAIAGELDLDESRVRSIHLASILHDIGKINIPVEILTSPRRLTLAESELLRTHVETGYDILKGIEFPWPIADFVLQHHERLDGTGYPCGLMGAEISLEARILAVADTVEAMATDRPYRPGPGIEVALNELEANRGVLYDADVVEACLTLFRTKGFTFTGGTRLADADAESEPTCV